MSDSTTQLRSTSDCAIVPELGVALGADMLDENIDLDQLVGKIAQKDESALDRLYDHTVQRVYGLALRITQNDGDAEEVVSDVYFQVWNQAKQFDHSRGNAMAWLMIITRSRALDLVRRTKSNHAYLGEVEEEIVAEDYVPEDLLAVMDNQSKIHNALQLLNETQRQLIALAFFRGYSHQELAEFTGMPLGTIKSHLKRSLSKLRDLMEESEELLGGVR